MSLLIPAMIMMVVGCFIILAIIILNGAINKIFQVRITTIIFGVVGILIFIFGKYLWYILDFINNTKPIEYLGFKISTSFWDNLKIANLALVSMPDMILLFLSISLIVDRSLTFAKTIAPFGFIIGLFFLIFVSLNYKESTYVSPYNLTTVQFIFQGDGITRMPQITYIFISVVSLCVIITSREYTKWSITSSLLFGAFLFAYSSIMEIFYNVGANGVTQLSYEGLSEGLGPEIGEYFPNHFFEFGKLLGINKDFSKYYIGTIIIVCASFVGSILVYTLKNLLTKDIRRMNFIFDPWYEHSFLFRNIGYHVDGAVNNFLSKYFKNSYLYGIVPTDASFIKNYLKYTEQANSSDLPPELRQKLMIALNELENKQKIKSIKKSNAKIKINESSYLKDSKNSFESFEKLDDNNKTETKKINHEFIDKNADESILDF